MACFHPLEAWRDDAGTITFDSRKAVGFVLKLPCGQCVGCRLERSRQWAMRCVHEASLYEDNCFITLTYSEKFLPADGSLNKKHFQLFMKKLRARFVERRIRFFHCGEYGAKYRRPHYHALLFNFDFADKRMFKVVNGNRLYTSDDLARCWTFGFSSIGSVTFESAAYVARYIMKKVTGDPAEDHYRGVHSETGELTNLLPEYTTMSRRPGIGRDWFDRFRGDVFPGDDLIMRGRSMRPPRFYDCLYERDEPDDMARIKVDRVRAGYRMKDDCTPERLAVREKCAELSLDRLPRGIEDGT